MNMKLHKAMSGEHGEGRREFLHLYYLMCYGTQPTVSNEVFCTY